MIEYFRGQISKAIHVHKTDMCVVFIKVCEGFGVDPSTTRMWHSVSFASQQELLGAALLQLISLQIRCPGLALQKKENQKFLSRKYLQ